MKKNTQDAGYHAAVGGAKKIIRVLMYTFLILAIVLLGKTAYGFAYDVFDQKPMDMEANAQEVTVTIKEDASIYQIGKLLKSKGLIEKPAVFWAQEKFSDYSGEISSGTYVLNTSQTVDEMMKILAKAEDGE